MEPISLDFKTLSLEQEVELRKLLATAATSTTITSPDWISHSFDFKTLSLAQETELNILLTTLVTFTIASLNNLSNPDVSFGGIPLSQIKREIKEMIPSGIEFLCGHLAAKESIMKIRSQPKRLRIWNKLKFW